MAIFMHIADLEGDVSAEGHAQWIMLESVDFGLLRDIHLTAGRQVDRERTIPVFQPVRVTKWLDKTSPLLFSKACRGKAVGTVTIDFCRTGDTLSPYAQYLLSDVIISHYNTMTDSSDEPPREILALHYTQITQVYTPRDASNQNGSPVRAGYDLIAAKVI